MPQLTVILEQDERVALQLLAKARRRDLRAQAAVLIRSELERLKMLPLDAALRGESMKPSGREDG